MKQFSIRVVCWFFLCVSLLMALQIHYFRWLTDNANPFVEVALEYGDLRKVAHMSDRDYLELLEEARMAGLTTLVLLDDQALTPNTELLHYVRRNGMHLAVQLSNRKSYGELNPEHDIRNTLLSIGWLPNLRLLFFSGFEVPGWPHQIDNLLHTIELMGIPVGYVEMLGEQKGLERVMALKGYSMVRTHPGYPYESLEDMVRSVRERSVRLLFLKPFRNMGMVDPETQEVYYFATIEELRASARAHAPGGVPLIYPDASADQVLLSWISQTRSRLLEGGFLLGGTSPIPGLALNPLGELYFQVGIILGAVLFLGELGGGRLKRLSTLTALAGGAVALGFFMVNRGTLELSPEFQLLLRDGYAMIGAVVFPTWGLVRAGNRLLLLKRQRVGEDSAHGSAEMELPPWRLGLTVLTESTLITIGGALIVNAMFSNTLYLSGWRFFRGVSLALLAPPVLVLLHGLWILQTSSVMSAGAPQAKILRLILGALGAVAAGFVLLRSGNEVATIPGLERVARLNLEELLGVRPRFKEFLVGHPAAMLLGWARELSWPEVFLGLSFLAAIGQASLFNTFMHIHIPVVLSLRRSLWGLALGEVIGLCMLGLALFLGSRFRRKPVLS